MEKRYRSVELVDSRLGFWGKFFGGCIMVFFISILIFLPLILVNVGAVDYLYLENEGEESVHPVVEYIFRDKRKDESREDYLKIKMNPAFLNDEGNDVPRIVNFYSPWCGHCQHYKPIYIREARIVIEKYPEIQFYGVSCTIHTKLCKKQEIRGYPTVKLFPPGATDVGKELKRPITAKRIKDLLDSLNVQEPVTDEKPLSTIKQENQDLNQNIDDAKKARKIEEVKPFQWVDRNDVFHDALASFEFALKNSIFMTNDALDIDKRRTLHDWLTIIGQVSRLSRQSLSHTESSPLIRLHLLSSTLLAQIDHISENEENLSQTLHDLSADRKEDKWTHACNKNGNHGYTCGLWQLFHLMTIGIAKSHHQSSSETMGPSHVAETLRDYIQHFFACDVCRTHFLHMYDECHFDRCNRFENGNDPSGHQLALWLWEVHNAVNVRLYHERMAESNENAIITKEDDQKVKWPSIESCPKCWNTDGSYNEDEIFNALEKQYW